MNNWKINKTVDLARGIDGIEVWPHALLVTGDKNAHEWNVTVMDNGNEASLSGVIEAYFVRSDGATVTAAGSVAGNVATVTLPEACYAYEGDLQAVMQLIQDDVSVTLSALLLRVRQITTDVIIDPGTEIPSLDDLLAQIESMKQATKDAGEATSKANTAAGNADAATEKANASAAAADASKEAADTAAEAANEAADRANKAASGVGIRKKIVDVLPAKAEMEQDVLYLVRRTEPNTENVYDEYMLINGDVEAIGSTKTDLEDYAKKDELAKVATSGSFADLSGTENLATKAYVGEQIDGIEIGGRNLCPDSSMEIGKGWDEYTYLAVGEGIDGGNCFKFHSDNQEIIIDLLNINEHVTDNFVALNLPEEKGKLTLSFYAKFEDLAFSYTDDRSMAGLNIGFVDGERYFFETLLSINRTASGTSGWKRYSRTFDFNGVGNFDKVLFYLICRRFTGTIWIDRIKVEKGNKVTDWSPAPEDLDAKIDSIEIGGTNLYTGTRDFSGPNWEYTRDWVKQDETYNGLTVYQRTGRYQGMFQQKQVKDGDIYTISLYARCINYDSSSLWIGANISSNNPHADFVSSGVQMPISKEWRRLSFKITATSDGIMRAGGEAPGEAPKDTTVQVCGFKLERGNKPTDWSPAPEDTVKQAVSEAVREVEVGGRNLLKNAGGTFILYGISNVSFQPNQIIQEWDTTTAIRASGSGGEHTEFGYFQGAAPNHWDANANYIASVYVKNNSADTSIRVVVNGTLDEVIVEPGEMKRAVIRVADRNSATSLKQIGFCTLEAGQAFDFTYWMPKIERGNVPTDLAPVLAEQTKQIRADVDYIAMMMEVEL